MNDNLTEKNLTAQSLIDWLKATGYEYIHGASRDLPLLKLMRGEMKI